MQVKICGITRREDAVAAAECGADAIGFVLWPGSKRAVTVDAAISLCDGLPPFLTLTALLVNPSEDLVTEVLDRLPVNLLQFHGDEAPAFCEQWRFPYLRALKMEQGRDVVAEAASYAGARGFLLDAVHGGQFGGTGRAFDWQAVPSGFKRPLILAGGLNADTVGEGIRQVRPAGVDVSTGVETAPGIKDRDKMREFVKAARSAAVEESAT